MRKLSRPWLTLPGLLAIGWGSLSLAQDRATPGLDSPVRNPAQQARDRAAVKGQAPQPLDQFVLVVPGRAHPSFASIVENDLVIRDAVGREWVYVPAPEYNSPDKVFKAYYSAESETWLLWPVNGQGPLQVGRKGAEGRVLFQPSMMTVRGSAKPAPGTKVAAVPEGPVPVADPAAAVAAVDRRIHLPGAYYVEGPDGGLATITRNSTTRSYEYVGPNKTSGGVDWMPRGSSVAITRGGKKVEGSATQQVLSFDKSNWYRMAILGCYFDTNNRPIEVVLNDGRVSVRTVNAEGQPVMEPLAVLSAVEVTSPVRGKARLRNGRLVWSDTKEEWVGPIWLQGFWSRDGRQCEVDQDGQMLTFTNDSGQVSKGKILTPKTLVASDWEAPGTIVDRQGVIEFQSGEKWMREGDEDFPIASPAKGATAAPARPLPNPSATPPRTVNPADGTAPAETGEPKPLPEKETPQPRAPKSKVPPKPVGNR